ncbi:hypothetical protein ACJ5H2_13630 [Nocardioides sp. R1-1]|uniref:hypothetical protein n=1 Tax=Nocardioides sp. R1-1 TaxID=3383502 RepID=UPI0038D1BC22
MTWESAGTAVAGFFIMCLTAYNAFQSAKAKREAQVAAGNTEKVRATLTTNNGGSHVKDSLDRIETRQQDQGEAIALLRQEFRDHLTASARTEAHLFDRLERQERRRFPFL